MRYDPMLATALAAPADTAAARVASWRQLVDIVAQARGAIGDGMRAVALARIAELHAGVPVSERRAAAASLATRSDAFDIVRIFAVDEPPVAAPVLAVAKLLPDEWLILLPRMPAASRAILRNRRDLDGTVTLALASFGLSDFGLPPADAGEWGAAADPGTQIRDLVARIEAFRRAQPLPDAVEHIAALPQDRATHFEFETAIDGNIDWVSGAPREALIGLGIAEAAPAGAFGVDGQAAGAFRRRAPLRDARLSVAGGGPTGGAWLISAAPVFNPRDGRFTGYHGSARRPRPEETTAPPAQGTALPADSLRQLIHELRTPLNAILGFAEMIDRQLLGPAASAYRGRAHEITTEAQRLVDLVDDLDQAARVQSAPAEPEADAASILDRVAAHFRPTLTARNVGLEIRAEESTGIAGVTATVLERMLTRLIGASLGLAAPGETVTVELINRSGGARLSVARPASLTGLDDATLLDPGYEASAEHGDGPLLGLGFTLRLIANLAQGAGGRFAIESDAFVLMLASRAALDEGVNGDRR